MIPPEDIEAIDEAFAGVHTFAGEVRGAPTPAPWYRDLLAASLETAPQGYAVLKLGLRHSTAMLAWAARYLLELNIYTQYALRSESDARRLWANRVSDGIDTYDAFQMWLARNDPSLIPPDVERAWEELGKLRAQQEEAPPRLPSLKYLSAEVGLADEYALLTRVAGKLSQPGIFSVTAGAAEFDALQPALFRAGAGYGMEIYQSVKDHFEAFGAAPRD